ncbi:hypothetical protein PIB30_076480 [Stylosanthes scabra]|uniref:Uncharacterized protein n=1 Tax=Stylosanthes scabra TaxID=79078 RepID=A0ABU6XNM9_9FABA|nr:hypothetical protein [Stylosanthes scabra]
MHYSPEPSNLDNFHIGVSIAVLFVATRSSFNPLRFYLNKELEYEPRITTQNLQYKANGVIFNLKDAELEHTYMHIYLSVESSQLASPTPHSPSAVVHSYLNNHRGGTGAVVSSSSAASEKEESRNFNLILQPNLVPSAGTNLNLILQLLVLLGIA